MCQVGHTGGVVDRGEPIVIVGGGIGGLALALSLHDAGFDAVDVYESAAVTAELGVGINVLPHAVRELDELGVAAELERNAVATEELVYFSSHGQRIWSDRRGRSAGYRWPQLSIHRGRLLAVLYRAFLDRLGPERIHHGHHLAAVSDHGDHASAHFSDRGSGATRASIEGSVVVGCDGVHSAVRAALVPDEGPPIWNGITMWRGITEAPSFLGGRTMFMAGHFERRVVVYPIEERGDRRLVNWVAELRTDDGRPMPPQEWDHRVDRAQVLDAFADASFDFCDVGSLIAGADAVFQYPMVDRDPLDSWIRGRVTLLGDAAHPMYPVGSNGASQAILDARALAEHLALAPAVDEALADYDAERRPATSAVVLANRRVGPEQCMELVHRRAPDGFDDISDVVSASELEAIAEQYRATAGFAVADLNSRPSRSVPPAPHHSGAHLRRLVARSARQNRPRRD